MKNFLIYHQLKYLCLKIKALIFTTSLNSLRKKNLGGREFIPKYTDIDQISDETIKQIVDLINNRPRKWLNWKKPKEEFSN